MSSTATELRREGGGGSRAVAFCALASILALYVVGFINHEVLRHLIQTAPLWAVVVLGLKGSGQSKWAALPCFLVWLALMSLIWLFLLGLSHVLSGTFSPTEILLTIIVGISAIAGMGFALRMRTSVRALIATAVVGGMLVLQVAVLWVSFLPRFAHD